ncbi:MAG: Ger(x)C family spore germination protein [Dehalobacter sp.]|nr:Ger(x)C family spore germination protein [Dehalobacter sp.]
MRSIQIILKLIPALCLVFVLSGCWSQHELNTLAIVSGVGLDKAKEPDIEMTVQIIKPGEIKSGKKEENGGSSPKGYLNLTNTGDSESDIARGFSHEMNKLLFFPHNQILVFSRDLAEEGLQNHIDFFVRDHETRLNTWVLISKERASEVLNVAPELGKVPAMEIGHLVESQNKTSQSSIVNLEQFITRLMSKTTAPIAPFIEITGGEKQKKIMVSGTAIFKKDKLVGQLDKDETRGLLWVINEVKSGIIEVKSPNGDGKASLEITRSNTKIIPEIIDGKIHFKIEIKEEGSLGSQSSHEDLALPLAFESLEKEQSAVIENEIMAALEKAKKLNTDIFGFGDIFNKKYPKEWKELEGNWDEVFPDIDVEFAIEAKLRFTGRITSPVVLKQE